MLIIYSFYTEPVTAENLILYASVLPPEVNKAYLDRTESLTIGLREENETAGAITGYLEGNTFVLSGFYILPQYRRNGGGALLFEKLCDRLPAFSTIEVEYTESEVGERRDLKFFLENRGFLPVEPEEQIYLSTVAAICRSDLIKYKMPPTPLFTAYTDKELRQYGGWAIRQGYPCPPEGFLAPGVIPELSTIVVDEGRVRGYVVVDDSLGGGLTVTGVFNIKDPKRLYRMLQTVVSQAEKLYDDNTPFSIPIANDRSRLIVEKLMPDARQIDHLWIREARV